MHPEMHDEPRWRRYLRFWRRNVAADVDDELTFHFEQRVAEFMAAGESREEAVRRARQRFGDVDQARHELFVIDRRANRRHDLARAADNLRQDVVFSLRGLRRSPGLTIACIVTIALGVGANGAMFSLADRLFARPPAGVAHPEQLRRLYVRTTWTVGEVPRIRATFTYRTFSLLDSSLAPRVRLAGYTPPDTVPAVVANAPMSVHASYVSPSYMSVLGIHPARGRFFAADEQVMGAPVNVAVISDRFWRRVFGGDPAAIGRVVEIDRARTTIIGVAPRGFDGPDLSAADVWLPLASYPESSHSTWYSSWFSAMNVRLLGRVAPGTPNDWISSAATTIVRRTTAPMPGGGATNAVRDTGAVMLAGPILESLGPSIKPAPEVAIASRLAGVTIIVLLIACANVASLLLARAMGRRREIAVRIALGASRSRLVAQLLCEGLLLAIAAAAAALVVSAWAGTVLRTLIMPQTYWARSAVDARVVAFIGLIAVGTGLLAGLVPALQASRPQLTEALKSGSRDGVSGAHRSRLRQLLLVTQVALSVLLLYGAGLYVHSLMRLSNIDMGFDVSRVVYGSVYPLDSTGRFIDWGAAHSSPRVGYGMMEAVKRIAAAPIIEDATLSTGGPMSSYAMIGVYRPDGAHVPELDKRDPVWVATTPSYLAATGSRLVRGRFFTDADSHGAPVMVVNETAARFYWPQRDAIGQCLRVLSQKEPCSTVIGIIGDSHVEDVIERPVVQLITPFGYDSTGRPRGANTVIARARPGQTAAAERLIRDELTGVFHGTAVPWVRSVQNIMEPQLRPWRVGLLLFGGFGVLALIVASLGTYSVLSYAVTQRTHEISVRIALGARSRDVLGLVVGQGVRLCVIGVMLGLVIALAASRVMQSLLYDTSPREPMVTLGVGVLLVVIAAAASALPARRAARVDPVGVLRAE